MHGHEQAPGLHPARIVFDRTDARVPALSEKLNAIQQLANALGVAVLGTVFFSALTGAHAATIPLATTAWVCLIPLAATFVLAFITAVLAAVFVLLGGALMAVVLTSQSASATTVPGPPAGWSTVFSDNFAGAAGSAPSASNWFYDIGSGYGTGEIEKPS